MKGFIEMQTAVVFSGPSQVDRFVAVTLRQAIKLYRLHGMKVNRAYTPTAMLARASQLTGKKFKRGQFAEAEAALTELLDAPVEVTERVIQ